MIGLDEKIALLGDVRTDCCRTVKLPRRTCAAKVAANVAIVPNVPAAILYKRTRREMESKGE